MFAELAHDILIYDLPPFDRHACLMYYIGRYLFELRHFARMSLVDVSAAPDTEAISLLGGALIKRLAHLRPRSDDQLVSLVEDTFTHAPESVLPSIQRILTAAKAMITQDKAFAVFHRALDDLALRLPARHEHFLLANCWPWRDGDIVVQQLIDDGLITEDALKAVFWTEAEAVWWVRTTSSAGLQFMLYYDAVQSLYGDITVIAPCFWVWSLATLKV